MYIYTYIYIYIFTYLISLPQRLSKLLNSPVLFIIGNFTYFSSVLFHFF